jgi:hypothetical protein
MPVKFSNNAATTLAANATNSATTITVVDGSVFPTLAGTDFTFITLEDVDSNREIVKLTAVSSNTLTIVRAQDGSSARAYSTNDKVELRLTAALLNAAVDSGAADLRVNSFTGDGSTLAYSLSSSPDLSNTLVYIDGIYQVKAAYAMSGQVLTLSAAPDSGSLIEVTAATVAPVQESTDFLLNQYTGNGSTTAFTLSAAPTNENQCSVFISGVYQSKANFSVSGSTLNFSTAPPSGSAIEVMVARTVVFGIGVPDDNTISTAKIQDDAVTSAKVDGTVATVAGAETLTNKTLTAPTINGGTHTAFTSTGIDDNATSTAITIDASGNITQTGANSADFLIKAPTDNASLTLQAGSSDAGAEGAFVSFLQNTTYKWQMGMNTDNSFRWYNYATSSEAMKIDSAGHAIIGGGITLGNGQTYAAANTLDHYETGTYAVALESSSGAYPTIASGALYGEYTKIGRLCHVIVGGNAVTLSGTTSGLIGFTLPFVPAGSNSAGFFGGGGFTGSGVTFVRTTHALCTNIGSRLGILTQTNGGSWNWESNSVFGNGANWRMHCTYQTA